MVDYLSTRNVRRIDDVSGELLRLLTVKKVDAKWKFLTIASSSPVVNR